MRRILISYIFIFFTSYSMGQTTVTLPTIPCSTCNGPGSFSISSPTCGGSTVTSPLTLSWSAATGASSYTIMIATDANFTQNIATTTVTATSLSIPNYALKASQLYYWAVFANNKGGSTKSGSSCQFTTDGTFTGTTPTGSFPNGEGWEGQLSGFSYSCQKGDGTCASGDNLICNPKILRTSGTNSFTPYWIQDNGMAITEVIGRTLGGVGVSLSAIGVALPPSGNDNALGVNQTGVYTYQPLLIRNTSASPIYYEASFYVKSAATATLQAAFWKNANVGTPSPGGTNLSSVGSQVGLISIPTSTSWQRLTSQMGIPAGVTIHDFEMGASALTYVTDIRLCKL